MTVIDTTYAIPEVIRVVKPSVLNDTIILNQPKTEVIYEDDISKVTITVDKADRDVLKKLKAKSIVSVHTKKRSVKIKAKKTTSSVIKDNDNPVKTFLMGFGIFAIIIIILIIVIKIIVPARL